MSLTAQDYGGRELSARRKSAEFSGTEAEGHFQRRAITGKLADEERVTGVHDFQITSTQYVLQKVYRKQDIPRQEMTGLAGLAPNTPREWRESKRDAGTSSACAKGLSSCYKPIGAVYLFGMKMLVRHQGQDWFTSGYVPIRAHPVALRAALKNIENSNRWNEDLLSRANPGRGGVSRNGLPTPFPTCRRGDV